MTEKRETAYNSTYPKVAVQWLNQARCLYQSLCLVDSEVLRNRGKNPEIGRSYNEITKKLLGLHSGRHIIFYQIVDDYEIEIIRILHERMD